MIKCSTLMRQLEAYTDFGRALFVNRMCTYNNKSGDIFLETGYGVYEDYHVLALLHQAHSALLRHFGYAGMMLRQLIKGGVQYLTLYAALHIRDFLGPLVYEQHYEGNVGIVVGYSVGYVLEQRSLAALGLADDKAALALAYG